MRYEYKKKSFNEDKKMVGVERFELPIFALQGAKNQNDFNQPQPTLQKILTKKYYKSITYKNNYWFILVDLHISI